MVQPPTDSDLKNLGFKSGLEIHQQLRTTNKLFCRCPTGLRNDPPHARIIRHMRPTLSELGEYDGTALMEFKTNKTVTYELYRESVCTYEMDDTPPFLVNQQALDIAIEIALLLNCSIVDEIHVSRKQYLDGSIPTGFQRTAVVGVNGWVSIDGRKVRIIQLALEEDACREVSDRGHTITFRTDRLSIPLVEVVTAPDMVLPSDVARVNWEIGRILRSTGKVRRGIGSVRQDVNVSVAGGTRVEIKGVPRIPMIPSLTRMEAMRQNALLKIRDVLRSRGITEGTFTSKDVDVSQIAKKTRFMPLKSELDAGGSARAVRLDGFGGIIGIRTTPTQDLACEISGRLKVIACLDRMPNMLHSEEAGESISAGEWDRIMEAADFTRTDAIVLVWAQPEDIDLAVQEVKDRAKEATVGIPSETRQVLAGGETGFERILPGPDRMYPDTDHPPIPLDECRVDGIRSRLPIAISRARQMRAGSGADTETIDRVIDLGLYDVYLALTEGGLHDLKRIDRLLTGDLVFLRRQGIDIGRIGTGRIKETVNLARSRVISWEGLRDFLRILAFNEDKSVSEAASAFGFVLLSGEEASERIRQTVMAARQEGVRFDNIDHAMGYLRSMLSYRVTAEHLREQAEELVEASP